MKSTGGVRISRKLIRSVHITRTGWAFILLTTALGIAGLNTGNNLLYLIFGMLLSMLLINGILSTSSLHNLEVKLQFPERLYVGANNPVRVEITNLKRRLPSFALTMQPPGALSGHFIFKINPGENTRFVHYQPLEQRGWVKLPVFRIHSSYPFGLIEKFIPIPFIDGGERVVYPELKPFKHDADTVSFFRGDYLSGEKGSGINPYGIREFQYGDDMRHMHWPSFAKVGKWMLKEFEHEKKTRVTINLICETSPTPQREATVSLAASLLMHFVEEQRQVALCINDRPVSPGDGKGYIDFYLTALALFDAPNKNTTLFSGASFDRNAGGTVIGVCESTEIQTSEEAIYDLVVHGGNAAQKAAVQESGK